MEFGLYSALVIGIFVRALDGNQETISFVYASG